MGTDCGQRCVMILIGEIIDTDGCGIFHLVHGQEEETQDGDTVATTRSYIMTGEQVVGIRDSRQGESIAVIFRHIGTQRVIQIYLVIRLRIDHSAPIQLAATTLGCDTDFQRIQLTVKHQLQAVRILLGHHNHTVGHRPHHILQARERVDRIGVDFTQTRTTLPFDGRRIVGIRCDRQVKNHQTVASVATNSCIQGVTIEAC